jgi:hypothetical protein
MTYIHIPNQYDAEAFLLLAKSGVAVQCFAENVYGIQQEHLTILKNANIPITFLQTRDVHLPKTSLAA